MKKISVEQFKARCLAIIEQARTTREPVLITKRGRPIVKLIPADEAPEFLGRLQGIVAIRGDIESPLEPPETWEVLR